MALRIYNTLSRQLEPLVPLQPGLIRMYACGPTVYDFAHIGNFRRYVFQDLLYRYLRYAGFQVRQVMNITDVDDKTIRGAREKGVPLNDYTRPFTTAFFDDLSALNILKPEICPAATAHIPDMIRLIETLFEKGFAYRSEDGSVYFSIAKFKPYGRLAHLDMSGLRPGARVAQDDYQKDNVADFALWKAWSEDDGDVAWESPWGRGRPGWHIECSAMSMKYLGDSFDLHTGGVDNIFPHHEDEIAQSEAATGQPFVKYWLHCAHLIVDGKKMSKSLGNFFTLRDLLQRGYFGREIRYALIAVNYRQTLNFTLEALDSARSALKRLDEFERRMQDIAASGSGERAHPAAAEQGRRQFIAALDDDLNISSALAALFDMAHDINKTADSGTLKAGEAAGVISLLQDMDGILGFLREETVAPPENLLRLAQERQDARKAKNWAQADSLRKQIETLGWNVQDTPEGPKLKRL